MADVVNRDDKEAGLAKPIAREFNRFKLQILGIIPGLEEFSPFIDPALWDEHTANLVKGISPVMTQVYMDQAETVMDDDDFEIYGVDWSLVNQDAIDWAADHTYDLVKDLNRTSQKTLQKVIPRYFDQQWNQGQLRQALEPTFGARRAAVIARTEVTRAASMGQLSVSNYLDQNGIQMKHIWHTRNDELVCPLCGPKNGKHIGVEVGPGYPPEHPNCRCWWGQEFV